MDDKKKILAIVNPISGTGKKDNIASVIEKFTDPQRVEVTLAVTERAGHAHEMAAQAASEGYDVVAAIGGDGTVNEVGCALCGSDTALAVIPCGSGNGLARHLRLPMSVSKSISLLNDGVVKKFDFCSVNGRPFFCTCGLGFDAQVSKAFADADTRGLITYVKTTINEYFKYQPHEYRITIDGIEINEKAFVIACCNASQYGNNAFIAPRASMQDGLIDMTIVHNINLLEAPLMGIKLFSRMLDQDHHVSVFRGSRITIERQEDDVIHIDGDPIEQPHRLEIECHHLGINILVPKIEALKDL